MGWQLVYLIVLYASAIISLGIAIYAWLNRGRPGLISFALMMLSVSEYSLTAGLMSSAPTPQAAVQWVHWHYLGLTSMLAFFITFVLIYTGHEKWVNSYTLTIFFTVPILTQIIIETNPYHHWFIREIEFKQDGILMGLAQISYGGFFWFHTIYSYVLVLVGIGLMIAMSVRTFKLYRMQSLTLFIAVLLPLLGSINDSKVFMAGIPFPIVPICFAMMGVLIAWNIFRYRLLSMIPVARDTLVESMQDSLIVIDVDGRVIDINPAALALLNRSVEDVIGKSTQEVFLDWPEDFHRFLEKAEAREEIRLVQEDTRHCFDTRVTVLNPHRGRSHGKMIVLREITQRVEAEEQVQKSLDDIRKLQQQLYAHSIHDPLTGLYNRRFLDEVMPREMANAARTGTPLCFVMMDIDHFKTINDTYGHAIGDQVLQDITALLKGQTRIGDLLFRYGGEEFLALLINTNAKAACQFAERWRKAVQDYCLIHQDHEIRITMSLGVAEYSKNGETFMEVLEASDRALYRAKDAGRNCVTSYDEIA